MHGTGRVAELVEAADDLDSLSDVELLRRFAATREDRTFALLVDRHGPRVWTACRGVGAGVHATEDAFQATFIVLARQAGSIRKPEHLGAWLGSIARRLATLSVLRS